MSLAPLIAGAVMAFLYGIVVGSFLNVCIYRLPNGESLISPPSHCPKCNTRLRSRDLVPLFSYLALRGKCRYCGTRISPRYFTIELITGLLFTLFWGALALRFPLDIMTVPGWGMVISAWIFTAAMLVTFMIDLDTTYVIEPVTWVAMGSGVVFELLNRLLRDEAMPYHIGPIPIPAALPGMIIGFAVFIGMDLFGRLIFRKPSMGLGDAFIGAAIGAMLGTQLALLSFGIAVFLGAIIGIILMVAGRLKRGPSPDAKDRKLSEKHDEEELPQGTYMPFGPFLTASAVLVALMPHWVANVSAHIWYWWIHRNPFIS